MAEPAIHPVTEELSEQWHKLLALAMFCRGERTLKFTKADIDRFLAVLPDGCIVCQPNADVLTLRLVTKDEGERLARVAEGLRVYG